MSTELETNNSQQTDDSLNLQDLLGMFLRKLPWFFLSLFLAFSVVSLYYLKTSPSYTRTASILVKENDKGVSSVGPSEIQDLGIFKNNTNINNELLTIKSPTLMTEVVKRLKLDDCYSIEDGLRTKELYKNTPVIVTFNRPQDAEGARFVIRVKDDRSIILSDFEDDANAEIATEEDKLVSTPVGEVSVTLTNEYSQKWNGKPITFVKKSLNKTIDSYTGALKVELGNKDATIINLSISNTSIERAEDILTTLITVYNENWIQDKNQIAVSTSSFINDRLRVIEGELGSVDQNISNFKSENLLPDVQVAATQYMSQSAENKKELLMLNSQLSTAQFIRKELQKQGSHQPLPTNTGIDNINLQSQISDYNTMLLDRNRLLENSSEKNPLVVDLNKSLISVREGILQSIDNVIASINMQISNLRTQESATLSKLASNPEQAKQLLSVERQQKVKEGLYLYLLQKREENELSQAFTAYNTRIITAPRGSMSPTAPSLKMLFILALAIGLLLPASIIYFLETFNTKVRGRKDIESLTMPFVGEIPLTHAELDREKRRRFNPFRNPNRKLEEHPIVVKTQSRNMVNEAFRVVRTNLEFMTSTDASSKVILVTSANPASGKTFISANLATSFAIKQKKVLVIDLDLRRASFSEYVNLHKIGLSNYLSGQNSIDDVIVRGLLNPNLDVIPVGKIPPNPTELLFSERLKTLLDTARQTYDYVFIDCPPVEIVADTTIISKFADVTLFIIRANLMEREMLPEVQALYTGKKFNNMAVILNGTSAAYDGKYGYHKYGYRYGYNYGYGSYESKEA